MRDTTAVINAVAVSLCLVQRLEGPALVHAPLQVLSLHRRGVGEAILAALVHLCGGREFVIFDEPREIVEGGLLLRRLVAAWRAVNLLDPRRVALGSFNPWALPHLVQADAQRNRLVVTVRYQRATASQEANTCVEPPLHSVLPHA